MKTKSIAAQIGLGLFVAAFLLVVIAFFSGSWIVSDQRLTGEQLERFGLWVHCFRSLPDPNDEQIRRFFVGCRWIYDPFTTGYDRIRSFLVPGFILATQFFFTINFLSVLIGAVLVIVYFSCLDPEHDYYLLLVRMISLGLLIGGASGCVAVLIFAFTANRNNWMPGHANNFFGWSFVVGVLGSILTTVTAILFFVERHIQQKKQRFGRQSQSQFQFDADYNNH